MIVSGDKLSKADVFNYKNKLKNLNPKRDFLIKYKISNGINHTIINLEDAVIEEDCIYNINHPNKKIEFKDIVSLSNIPKIDERQFNYWKEQVENVAKLWSEKIYNDIVGATND